MKLVRPNRATARAYLLLFSIACLEILALAVLLFYPSKTTSKYKYASSSSTSTMKIVTPAFKENELIPSQYTCEGKNSSPSLTIENIPSTTISVAVIMYDPDVPKVLKPDGIFVHWVVYNLIPDSKGTLFLDPSDLVGAIGKNSSGAQVYTGPCPPREYEPKEHRYIFTAYALDIAPKFEVPPTRDELLVRIKDHTITTAILTGRYQKSH